MLSLWRKWSRIPRNDSFEQVRKEYEREMNVSIRVIVLNGLESGSAQVIIKDF